MVLMDYNPHCVDSTGASRARLAHSTPPLRARIDGWTPERQRLFCKTRADCGLFIHAAQRKRVFSTPGLIRKKRVTL
jgi:hypothetical protein